jgi:formylglycine-generating enzyme required for sulfatase activity
MAVIVVMLVLLAGCNETISQPDWVPELVEVPAGPFLMGSSDDDAAADDDEKPQHELTLDTYWIGKTEVTNAQFRPFVEGDGYSNPDYWTEAGWQWREEESVKKPFYWEESTWNGDAQPVVGVTWYEAVAYTRWLSAQTGRDYRLPTEAEWEKAARGTDGRIYPWGNEFDQEWLNSGQGVGQGGHTTPVGTYPKGASPYGALDMAGNAHEWTATKSDKEYPYEQEDEWSADYLAGSDDRVLRGGAYWRKSTYTRCGMRIWIEPDFRVNNDMSFRVVATPQ